MGTVHQRTGYFRLYKHRHLTDTHTRYMYRHKVPRDHLVTHRSKSIISMVTVASYMYVYDIPLGDCISGPFLFWFA